MEKIMEKNDMENNISIICTKSFFHRKKHSNMQLKANFKKIPIFLLLIICYCIRLDSILIYSAGLADHS